MDTNTVTAIQTVMHADPQSIMTTIAAWSAVVMLIATTLGRAWHAFQTGSSPTAAVFKGTNTPTGNTEFITKPDK